MILAPQTYRTLLVPLALCLVACGAGNEEPQSSTAAQVTYFTGRLPTADAVVGLVVSDQGAVDAYVCGGDSTFATESRWFVGSFSSGSASLETEGRRLDLTLRGDTTDVTLTTPDGVAHSTVADRADAGNHSALYESAPDAACRWGVVVRDEGGAAPEITGTWCGEQPSMATMGEPAKIFAQVTPVLPIDFSKASLSVLVNTPDGEKQFDVRRASPSLAGP